MTPEAQGIAIVEACRWKQTSKTWDQWTRGTDTQHHSGLPDYLNDLNAIAEAVNAEVERTGFPFQEAYIRALRLVVTRRRRNCNEMQVDFWMAEATAAQRAEAFLRTLGKWQDSPPPANPQPPSP